MAFNYPNGPDDHSGIIQYAKDIAQANRTFWHAVEMAAWRNILFFMGIQRLVYSSVAQFWRPLGLSKDTPRPVTNRVKPLINDLASKLIGFKPPITWGPGSDQEADYVAASVADRVNTAIEKEADIRSLKPIAARWLALTANVFPVSTYDNSPETGTTFVQAERCLDCGKVSMPKDIQEVGNVCPQCGSMTPVGIGPEGGLVHEPVPNFQPAVDPNGTKIGLEYPRGRHLIELENVFTTRFDPQCGRFHKSPYVRIARTMDKSWVAERWGDEFAESVAFSRATDPYSTLFDSLAMTALGGGTVTSASTGESDRALVERIWIRPHPTKAPGGIHAVIIGEKIAESGSYPYHDERNMPMLNVAHIEFDQVPGRVLASTRCDDIIPLQEEINELDALIKLHHRRMANAVWTVPHGSDPTKITGEGGIYIRYNPLATGHKPERAAGIMVPPDIYNYREIRKKEMDEIFGSLEVSRGEAPRGVSAYAALQMLDERASQGQSNIMANWALGWMEVSRQNINIWREWADEDRTISLGVGRWATKKFSKAEMIGGVDIDVDVGPGRPMTMVAKMARIGQCIQEGVINVFDPQVRHLILRAAGIPELMPDYNKHYIRAARIVDQIISARSEEELPPPIIASMPFDNHSVHLEVLQSIILDEVFETLQDFQKKAIILLAQIHYEALREDMLNQQARAGQNAPRIAGKKPSGGGGGGDNGDGDYNTEEGVLDHERQDASPDVMTGARV